MSMKFYRWLLIVLAFLAATAMSSYFAAFWMANTNQRLITYLSRPYITAAKGERITASKPGKGIVLNLHVRRQPYHCWADHVTIMNGPVSFSFPIRRSQIISDKVTESYLKQFLVLPDDLPPGSYTFQQVIYPTCYGVQLNPYLADFTHVQLDIIE